MKNKNRPWRQRMYSVRVIGKGIVAIFPIDMDIEHIKEWASKQYNNWFIQKVNVRIKDFKRSGKQVDVVYRDMQQTGFFGTI